jgi:AmmeMemoRadiSam system protein B
MSIKSFSKKKILDGLERHSHTVSNRLRVLFVQEHITEEGFEVACKLYSNLMGDQYDDIVIIERLGHDHDKLLPMVSNNLFITPFGPVTVNDQLRNDFCDEDDDFFIDDEGYSENMCAYDHLMMLQCVMDDFKVVSIQVADERPSIIRELAMAVSELLRERNSLVIVCSDVSGITDDALDRIKQMIEGKEHSRLLNYLNTGDAGLVGTGPFAAGVLVSDSWELTFNYEPFEDGKANFLAGWGALKDYKPKS